VAGSGGSVVFDVSEQQGWLVFPITHGGRILLFCSFALTRERSYISRVAQANLDSVQRFLQQREPGFAMMATSESGSAHTLSGFQIAGQSIGDVDVRVSGALARAPFDVLLGLNFLRRYGSICFDPHASRISLEPPTV